MKTVLTFFVFQMAALLAEGEAVDIIKFFTPCSIKDPQLNNCVKETGQKFIPSSVNGIPELKIPKLDPMEVAAASFGQQTKDTSITINYKNIILRGIAQVVIKDAKMDIEKGTMEFHLFYPSFIWEADYVAKGNLYNFQVDGTGKANITVWDAKSKLVINFHISNDHMVKDSVKVEYEFDKIFLDYTNLRVNDDDELSASAGSFINENSKEILNGFKSDLEKFYGNLMGDHLTGFFETIPYSSLFKDV